MVRSTVIILVVLAALTPLFWLVGGARAARDLLIFAALCSPIYVAIWVFAREVPESERGFLARKRKPRKRRPPPIETFSCPECGLDLTDEASPVCPDCGRVLAQS
ncbi:MAG: hypothetical protein PVI86_14895 [Phycisphaerae bacterium]|jgi:hypothetical protein